VSSQIIVYTKYDSGNEFGGALDVNKLIVSKFGGKTKPNSIHVRFEGVGSIKNARMTLDLDLAVPLARSFLSIAEGYVSKLESEFA
jgi:hypothetical protein